MKRFLTFTLLYFLAFLTLPLLIVNHTIDFLTELKYKYDSWRQNYVLKMRNEK